MTKLFGAISVAVLVFFSAFPLWTAPAQVLSSNH